MSFDYFYGLDDAERYSFCRISKRLIKRKRQGLGESSLIYVLKFSTSCPQNDSESHF